MTPQIVVLVVAHGLAMLSWMVLFCVQSALIVADRRHLHIKLGRIGAFLAGAIVIFGIAVAPLSVHYNPAACADFGGARYFLALMWPEPVAFGVFVTLALAYRVRPEVHRPMMLLATTGLMTGSLDRMPYWNALVRFVDGSIAVAMFGQMLAARSDPAGRSCDDNAANESIPSSGVRRPRNGVFHVCDLRAQWGMESSRCVDCSLNDYPDDDRAL